MEHLSRVAHSDAAAAADDDDDSKAESGGSDLWFDVSQQTQIVGGVGG